MPKKQNAEKDRKRATKHFHINENETILKAIERVDHALMPGENGSLPIFNFDVEKWKPIAFIKAINPQGEKELDSVAISIRRRDRPEIELGVAIGSVGGEYNTLPNMQMADDLFVSHDDFANDVEIWSTENGKVCGIEAVLCEKSFGGHEWICKTTMRQSHDLTLSLETTGQVIRKSDGLRIPITLKNGVIKCRHTARAKDRMETIVADRKKANEVMFDQTMLMESLSKVKYTWGEMESVLWKAIPEFDPTKATTDRSINQRKNIMDAIRRNCFGSMNALDYLLGFMKWLSQESKTRVCSGKSEEEVRFESLITGQVFRRYQKVQSIMSDSMKVETKEED